jgi:carboxyl-terminal processing protease
MQENNKVHWFTPISYALILIVGIGIGVFLKGTINGSSWAAGANNPIPEIIQIVNGKYVDSVKSDSATQKVADFYLSQLDPHSVYIPPSDLAAVNEQLQPNFKGIGIEFQQFKDSVYVSYVMKNGPADKAGLQIGDLLLKADDSIVLSGRKWEGEDIRKKLKGPSNTKVSLTIARAGQTKKIIIERDNVSLSPVEASYLIKPGTGYIKIARFADRTYEAFMQALEPLLKDSIKSLVIDLRGNGGGLLSEAVAIADELLAGNKLIVYTQGVHSPRVDYFSKREGLFEEGKLTVLMDESSASASEVLAGALQDWDRATIVGTRSFGKGLVQQQFRLSNGGALRLTTAKYFSPLGRNIQRPYESGKLQYEHDYFIRIKEDASGKQDSSIKGKAYKTPKGHVVYGGGGIYPDKWVASSTIIADTSASVLYENSLLNEFIFKYYVSHKKQMDAFPNVAAFLSQNQNIDWWKLLNEQSNNQQKIALGKIVKYKPIVHRQILAQLARMRWYKQGLIEVQNTLDPNFADMQP